MMGAFCRLKFCLNIFFFQTFFFLIFQGGATAPPCSPLRAPMCKLLKLSRKSTCVGGGGVPIKTIINMKMCIFNSKYWRPPPSPYTHTHFFIVYLTFILPSIEIIKILKYKLYGVHKTP